MALVARTFVVTGYQVPKFTMAPTLIPGDYIFSFKIPYGVRVPLWQQKIFVRSPDRGTVVVFSYPHAERVLYVKRVVGLAGDRIRIENGKLWVNDVPAVYRLAQTPGVDDLPGFQFYEESLFNHQRKVALPFRLQHSEKSILVPQGHVFVLGDLRDLAKENNNWETVPLRSVEGSVSFIGLSLAWHRKSMLPEWRRQRFLSEL